MLSQSKTYEFLEHTADAYVAAYGKDLAEAFENAAVAMFDVMTDVKSVEPVVEDFVSVQGMDKESLLYNWLEDLLVKAETKEMLYSKFQIQQIKKLDDNFMLQANIFGEKFDPKKHLQKVGVKAITYHDMEIIEESGKVTLRFLLDI